MAKKQSSRIPGLTKRNRVRSRYKPGNRVAQRNRAVWYNGRAPMQIEEDKFLIARYRRAGLSDPEISEKLNEREGNYRSIAPSTVGKDRNEILDDFRGKRESELELYFVEQLDKLDEVEEMAREGWAASTNPTKAVEVRELQHMGEEEKIRYLERETRTITSAANPSHHFLKIMVDVIDKRAKLWGLYKYQAELNVNVRQETTHHVKHYIGWSPEEWDKQLESGDRDEIADGEFEPA